VIIKKPSKTEPGFESEPFGSCADWPLRLRKI
jgi:hypothetical protein